MWLGVGGRNEYVKTSSPLKTNLQYSINQVHCLKLSRSRSCLGCTKLAQIRRTWKESSAITNHVKRTRMVKTEEDSDGLRMIRL